MMANTNDAKKDTINKYNFNHLAAIFRVSHDYSPLQSFISPAGITSLII